MDRSSRIQESSDRRRDDGNTQQKRIRDNPHPISSEEWLTHEQARYAPHSLHLN